jgi:hypothetical protein
MSAEDRLHAPLLDDGQPQSENPEAEEDEPEKRSVTFTEKAEQKAPLLSGGGNRKGTLRRMQSAPASRLLEAARGESPADIASARLAALHDMHKRRESHNFSVKSAASSQQNVHDHNPSSEGKCSKVLRKIFPCLPKRRPMSTMDSLRLSPFQKFVEYGRIPYKFLINVALLILTTVQVILINTYIAPYNRAQFLNFQSLLTPQYSGIESTSMGARQTFHIYRISTLSNSVQDICDTYYQIQNISVDYYDYLYDDNSEVLKPTLEVQSYQAGTAIFDPFTSFDNTVTTSESLMC